LLVCKYSRYKKRVEKIRLLIYVKKLIIQVKKRKKKDFDNFIIFLFFIFLKVSFSNLMLLNVKLWKFEMQTFKPIFVTCYVVRRKAQRPDLHHDREMRHTIDTRETTCTFRELYFKEDEAKAQYNMLIDEEIPVASATLELVTEIYKASAIYNKETKDLNLFGVDNRWVCDPKTDSYSSQGKQCLDKQTRLIPGTKKSYRPVPLPSV
jgi:acetone carboxylase gamma subunit